MPILLPTLLNFQGSTHLFGVGSFSYKDVTREQIVAFAAELKRRVMSLQIEHRYSKALPVVTVSQGICWDIPRKGNKMWDFLHSADNMLYRVKKFSRNTYCVGDVKETDDMILGTLQ